MTINGNIFNCMTPPGIATYEYLVSWQGGGYILYPIRGEHTEEDVKAAKQYIREKADAVRIETHWQKRGT